jgi:transposase IS4-like protein
MYWRETFSHSFITSLFSRDRFKQLLSYFRVVPAPVAAAPRNPIPHVRALAEKLNQSFAAHFNPTEHLTIDEAMCAWKGRSSIKQYIPMKPHKYGYKIYCLASENYLLHFEVYEGKEEDPSESGATYDTVIRMIQPYQNQQLILFTDSWFTSPSLMNALAAKGIRMCGSVRSNRKGLPKIDSKAIKSLRQGEWIQRQSGDMTFTMWKDQQTMKLLYNHVSPNSVSSLNRWSDEGERISIGCPQAIHDYFYHARSVDVINQLHYNYLIGRKSRRCWPRLAWWLLDMCIINAFKLWSIGQLHPSQLDFREQLMHELITQLPAEQRPREHGAALKSAHALASEHFIIHADTERDCKVCSHQPHDRKLTRLVCDACGVHLCMGNCFSVYHSKQ